MALLGLRTTPVPIGLDASRCGASPPHCEVVRQDAGPGRLPVSARLASRPVRACLFDVDGTLVESPTPIFRSLNSALDDVGLAHITRTDLKRIIGPPLRSTFETLVEERGAGPETVEHLLNTYREEYRTASIDWAASYPGVPGLLDELAGTTRLAVVTSKPAEYAIPILDALGFSPKRRCCWRAHRSHIAGVEAARIVPSQRNRRSHRR